MRFLIAIVLGTLMFQGSPLPLPRDKHVRTQWNVENTAMEHAFDHAREKRSIKGAVKGPKSGQTNDRIVRIYHAYYYFLHVSNNGKVGGTKDMVNGNVHFRMETYGTSLYRLFNIKTQRYIAINKRGIVITVPKEERGENSLFRAHNLRNAYIAFSLAKYPRDTWLLTLKKNGKVKNAKRTNPKMKATHFLLF